MDSIERDIRLAKDHLDGAEETLRAEQRRAEVGPDNGQRWPNHDRLGQNRTAPGAAIENTGQRVPVYFGHEQAETISREGVEREAETIVQRQMTPDEIRLDEATGLLERIGMIGATTGPYAYRGETERILRGRIDALRPEQTSSEEAGPGGFDPAAWNEAVMGSFVPEGLRYRQEVEAGMRIEPNTDTVPIVGTRLLLQLGLSGGQRAYDIPPYQVDQLIAIADGRPSWPDTSVPAPTDRQQVVSEEVHRLLAIDAGLRLLAADEPEFSGLSSISRHDLSETLCRAIASFL